MNKELLKKVATEFLKKEDIINHTHTYPGAGNYVKLYYDPIKIDISIDCINQQYRFLPIVKDSYYSVVGTEVWFSALRKTTLQIIINKNTKIVKLYIDNHLSIDYKYTE